MIRAILIGAVLALAALAVWHRPPDAAPAAVAAAATPARHAAPKAAAAQAVVYVAGAVARPGLYRVAGTGRVADAVALAGGLLADADPIAINLAAHVRDGDEIVVTVRGAPSVAMPARSRKTATARTRAAKTVPAAPVNVNAADAQTLATVPGVGAVIARRIIEVRENDGPYTSLDQLLDVAGMTLARLDRASPYLTI